MVALKTSVVSNHTIAVMRENKLFGISDGLNTLLEIIVFDFFFQYYNITGIFD